MSETAKDLRNNIPDQSFIDGAHNNLVAQLTGTTAGTADLLLVGGIDLFAQHIDRVHDADHNGIDRRVLEVRSETR